jgi:hypothetical protein
MTGSFLHYINRVGFPHAKVLSWLWSRADSRNKDEDRGMITGAQRQIFRTGSMKLLDPLRIN